jgi:hypothetical protein
VITESPTRTAAPAPRAPERSFLHRHVRWIVALVILGGSAAIVRWAGTRPGYDPYGWLIWGYQTLHGTISLRGAPSWKPLPWVFTTPFALFGHFQLWLWMTLAVAASIAGSVFAARIAFRVVDDSGRHRWPAVAAAVAAALGLVLIFDNEGYSYLHYVLSVQSDPPIVSLCLAAIDLYMIRRHRWAIAMLTLASLGRPEVWPFLGLYCLWYWRRVDPGAFWYVAFCVAIVPVLWFGVPTITNGDPLVAASLAQGSPRMLHSNRVLGTIARFKDLNLWPVWVAAGLGSAWAFYRRRGLVMALFACVVIWMVIEVAFSLHGWPSVPRYMFEPAGVSVVIAAIAFGWLLSGEITRSLPLALRGRRGLPAWPGIVVAAGLLAWAVPGSIHRARAEHADLTIEHARTAELSRLAGIINVLGGRRALLHCGTPTLDVEWDSAAGWLLHLNTDQIGYKMQWELHQRSPIVLLTALPNGWAAYAWHARPACARRMRVLYLFTPHHRSGVVVPNRVPPKVMPLHARRRA